MQRDSPVTQSWNDRTGNGLAPAVETTLQNHHVQWTSICPFRLPRGTNPPRETLLIGVVEHSMSEAEAKEVVFQVQQVLQQYVFSSITR